MSDPYEGGCLCGAVRYRSVAAPALVGDCYCVDCRRSSGTSHCTHLGVPEAGFQATGRLRFFEKPADSGNRVSRGFCPDCGSAVYSTNAGVPGMVFIRASSLDDPDIIEPQMTVYASRAPKWARIDESRPVFQEMPEGGPRKVAAEA